LLEWRRDGDLNSGGKIPHDFQSCAIPGYAISAAIYPSTLLVFTLPLEEFSKSDEFLSSIIFVGTFGGEVEQPLVEGLSFFAELNSLAMVFAKDQEIQSVLNELLERIISLTVTLQLLPNCKLAYLSQSCSYEVAFVYEVL
tara:strand:+ start:2712 stop:3134 length:423 start_codon:yes stop_codon:yes gene_type:complete